MFLRTAVIALVLLCVDHANAECDEQRLLFCNSKLAKFIGMPDGSAPYIMKNYTVLYDYFLTKFGNNAGKTDDILNACNGLEQYNQCMKATPDCFSLQYLLSTTDIQNTYMCLGTLYMNNFNCGPGVNTLVHEGISCFQRLLHFNQDYFQQCTTSYVTAVTLNKNGACGSIQQLINAWGVPFKTTPCRPTDNSYLWWTCETNNILTNPQFPTCGIDCNPAFQYSSLALHMSKHYKMENDEHWAKVPDVVYEVDGEQRVIEGKWFKLQF